MGSLHSMRRSRRTPAWLRWPDNLTEVMQYLLAATAIGAGAALPLNAYEARQERQATLQALPAGYQFPNCNTVFARNLDPLYSGEPGYSERIDGDGDGKACETPSSRSDGWRRSARHRRPTTDADR